MQDNQNTEVKREMARRPYEAPRVVDEAVFEGTVLKCGTDSIGCSHDNPSGTS